MKVFNSFKCLGSRFRGDRGSVAVANTRMDEGMKNVSALKMLNVTNVCLEVKIKLYVSVRANSDLLDEYLGCVGEGRDAILRLWR